MLYLNTHLDIVVGGKSHQIVEPSQLCNSEEITVEGSLAKSAGEARSTHSGGAGKKNVSVFKIYYVRGFQSVG